MATDKDTAVDNDYAVIVGINRYPDLVDLQGPVADAEDFKDWLLNEGQVEKENIFSFISSSYPPPPPAEPTEFRVATQAFKQLGDRVRKGGRIGRRLYIYMSGHGLTFDADLGQQKVAVFMANASDTHLIHHIPCFSYALWFSAARAFDEIVVFIDCCRDNRRNSPEFPFPCKPVFPDTKTTRENRVKLYIGYATQTGDVAREKRIGPGGQMRGIFTMALLAGLRGKARRENGKIKANALEGAVYSFIDDYYEHHDRDEDRQEPDFKVEPKDFVFTFP